MLVKGQLRGDTKLLAEHLARTDTNESVSVISANMAGTIQSVLETMRCMHGSDKRSVLHAKISVEPSVAKNLTQKDWNKIIREYIKYYKLEAHGYIAVQHVKNGNPHLHLVFTARDFEKKLFNDYKIFKRNISCQIAICKNLPELNMKPARIGVDQFGKTMKKRMKTDADFRREVDRPAPPGATAEDVAKRILKIWEKTECFEAVQRVAMFQAGLQKSGFALVMGKRGPGIIKDNDPSTFNLLSRRLGVKAAIAQKLVSGLELPALDDVKKNQNIEELISSQHENTRKLFYEAEEKIKKARDIRIARNKRVRGKLVSDFEISKMNCACGTSARSAQSPSTKTFSDDEIKAAKLHLHLKELGLEKSGVWKCSIDASWRFHVRGTGETVAIHPNRISIHSRPAPSPASDDAIRAMIEAAKSKGWTSIKFTGDEDFRKRAALEADKAGIRISDADLRKFVASHHRQQATAIPPERREWQPTTTFRM